MRSSNPRSWSISYPLNIAGLLGVLWLFGGASLSCAADAPDIRSVVSDLVVPDVVSGPVRSGKRVAVRDRMSGVDLAVYLPRDWQPSKRYPVIIELPGNGGYRSPYGDVCTGMPADCSLGYGLTAGEGAIWIAVPFLNDAGNDVARTWWGDAPKFNPQPTVDLVIRTVDYACAGQLNGDRRRVMLVGFSRGSIACNYIGLHNDTIAKLWCAMVCYSHYDGVRLWKYPGSDRIAAARRLTRLRQIPQFICHETTGPNRNQLDSTRALLRPFEADHNFVFQETGFRNHSDQWVLRPSVARDKLRGWYRRVVSDRAE